MDLDNQNQWHEHNGRGIENRTGKKKLKKKFKKKKKLAEQGESTWEF